MAARSLEVLEALAEESGSFSEVDRLWQTNTLHRLFWNRNPGNGDSSQAETLRLNISFLVQCEHVNVQSQDGIGNTALHLAAKYCLRHTNVDTLLHRGGRALANHASRGGKTPLHWTAQRHDLYDYYRDEIHGETIVRGEDGLHLFQFAYTTFDGVNTTALSYKNNTGIDARQSPSQRAITEGNDESDHDDWRDDTDSDVESPTFFSATSSRRNTLLDDG
ncbi:uncharacterized protein Z518_01042 [Rhinocladiella mackenziei CBS 650.93]|uniref:Uncharacterized protein n=1 Tax=Rhinocladiella mackenziei CBS 650.93 TaxID=1442369 RepID=A0A0D2J2T5_9EURO|nr:uncharacterized protein Z518_01042 [Rhinocladiella mackenziei CBS 650.93]KIX09961.1 hypothetical protein Z518_01042 [Rhinocladiella mackenziei CBS 650.93]